MADHNLVTSKQMALFTFVAQTGVGVIMLPNNLAKEVGHDGWLSVAFTGILAIGLSSLLVVLLRRYKDKAIYDINKLLFGKVLGMIFNILLLIYLLCAAAAGIRIFGLFLKIILLPNTPSLILTSFVLIPTFYIVWQGFKVVCRFKYMTSLSYVIFIIYIVFIYKDYHFSFILPVGEAGIIPLIKSMRTSFFAFLGLELVVFLYPEITDKHNTLKWQMIATALSLIFMTIVVIACTVLFGENLLSKLNIPLFNIVRVYNAPILERVDLYMVALWFIAMGCSMRAYSFTTYYTIRKVFNIKQSKVFFILYFALLIFLSRIPDDINEAYQSLEFVNLLGMGVIIFIILCLGLSFIRKKGVKGR